MILGKGKEIIDSKWIALIYAILKSMMPDTPEWSSVSTKYIMRLVSVLNARKCIQVGVKSAAHC